MIFNCVKFGVCQLMFLVDECELLLASLSKVSFEILPTECPVQATLQAGTKSLDLKKLKICSLALKKKLL